MKSQSSTYQLDAAQFDQALAILRKEQQANMPSRWQKISFTLLNVAVYGFAIVLLAHTVLELLPFRGLLEEVIHLLAYPWAILVLLSPILFVFNLPLGLKLWRQGKLVRRLGLSQALNAPWRAERRKGRFRNVLTLIVGYLGGLFILGGVIVGVFLPAVFPMDWSDPEDVLVFLLVSSVPIMVGVVFIVTHFIRRGKERLDVVARLQSSLAGYKADAEGLEDIRIELAATHYKQIAQIERAQILRDRAESIRVYGSKGSDVSGYGVQKSRTVREALAQLDPTARLRVEDQIDQLAMEPRPPGVTEDANTGNLRLRVTETPVEIFFTIDEDKRRIKMFSLQLVAEDATSNSQLEG